MERLASSPAKTIAHPDRLALTRTVILSAAKDLLFGEIALCPPCPLWLVLFFAATAQSRFDISSDLSS